MRSIKFVSWTLLVIEESLSYCLAGLRYSPFAYLTIISLYPFIQWLKNFLCSILFYIFIVFYLLYTLYFLCSLFVMLYICYVLCLLCSILLKLGDNCIQNFHLGRYIIGYTVGNLVLRRRASGAVKRDLRTYIRRDTSPNENFEIMVIPILMHFCSFVTNLSVGSRIKPHVTKRDVT